MLASTLIRRFVGGTTSTAYLAVYCDHYAPGTTPAALPQTAPPPGASVAHAATMAATLRELAEGLDTSGVQVHQEGTLARFEGAATAPDYGRNPGAAAARRKTAAFYAAVLRAAVAESRAATFAIPAAPWQGAAVALQEANIAATRYRTAAAAMPWVGDATRPELEAARLKHEADRTAAIGRAISMHSTAMAEAIGTISVAEGGDWAFVATRADQIPPAWEGLVVGIEVPASSPVHGRLLASLDPQHGGGTFGLGCTPSGRAACTAAMEVVRRLGATLPRSTRYVTTRLDPDAIVAAMILSGRIPLEAAEASSSIRELEALDDSSPTEAPWTPGIKGPQSVSDHDLWGPVAAMCSAYGRPGGATLPQIEAAVHSAVWQGAMLPMALGGATAQWSEQAVAAMALRPDVIRGIAVGREWPVGPGTFQAAYAASPVAVLVTEYFRAPSWTGRKYTIGTYRGCPRAMEFHVALRRRLGAGWGGAATITGSPFAGPATESMDQVLAACTAAAAEVGLALPQPPEGVIPRLR